MSTKVLLPGRHLWIAVIAVLAACLGLLGLGCEPGQEGQLANDVEGRDALVSLPVVSLYTWYSPSRGDYFTTSDPYWIPNWVTTGYANHVPDTRSPDYTSIREEGRVFSPNSPQPPDTVPLYSWYSPSKHDNFITSDPNWAGPTSTIIRPDYQFVRLEGYAYKFPVAGSLPLRDMWNASDRAASTSPEWTPGAATVPSGHVLNSVLGYVLPPVTHFDNTALAQTFGFGAMKVNGKPAQGIRPLVIIKATLPDADAGFDMSDTQYTYETFGPGYPNAHDFFVENSMGQFTWSSAGFYPVTLNVGYVGESSSNYLGEAIERAATAGFSFATYDNNHDGIITPDELSILMITNGASGHAGIRAPNTSDGCVKIPNSVVVCGPMAVLGINNDFSALAHELAHLLGTVDLYGSTDDLSDRATLMSRSDSGSFHLDPWHKMQLGWIEPHIVSLRDVGSVESLYPQENWQQPGLTDKSPLLIYDPVRGKSEFYMFEYRAAGTTAFGGVYDQNCNTVGINAWYVQQDSNHAAVLVPGEVAGYQDRTVWTQGFFGRGDSSGWSNLDNEFHLPWLDGTDTGVTFRIGLVPGGASELLEWHPSAQPLLGRVDSVSESSAHNGIIINGLFPVAQESRYPSLVSSSGTTTALTASAWSGTQITASYLSRSPKPEPLDVAVSENASNRGNGLTLSFAP